MTVFACSQNRYKRVVYSVLGFIALLFLLYLAEWMTQPQILPFLEVKTQNPGSFSVVFDRKNQVLDIQRRQFDVQQLPWQSLDQFSKLDVQTIVSNEDKRFYSHGGVDLPAMLSVLWSAAQGKLVRGGSTISMQLVRMLLPKDSMPRTAWGKWLQLRAAWVIERHWTKSQILEAYLNLVPLRGDVRGIHTAKKIWFNDELQLSPKTQAVLLTAMIPSPQAPLLVIANRACRLAVFQKLEQTCDALKKSVYKTFVTSLGTSTHTNSPWPSFAPHAARRLAQKGGNFSSTLDVGIQHSVQTALNDLLDDLYEANVRDAAAVVLDNATGEVLAYVGSAGRRSKSPQVDGARASRQPASAIKPFIYALAFDANKLSMDDKLATRPQTFAAFNVNGAVFKPRHEGPRPAAWVSPREALGGSMNIPAVLVLQRVGLIRAQQGLKAFGLANSDTVAQAGLALALGSHEVNLLDMTNAYRTIANGGLHSPVRWTRTSAAQESQSRRIVSTASADLVKSILSDPEPRNRAFGSFNALNTQFPTMSKTGTSNNARDNWALGSSSRHTVGVWIGNFEHDTMQDIYGPAGAGIAWREIMENLHRLP